jgi:hypothetical protein
LSTPWQLSSASYVSISSNINSISGQIKSLTFADNGQILHIIDENTKNVKEYKLETVWNTGSNINFVNNSVSLASSTSSLEGMYWKSNGRSAFIISRDLVSIINEYALVPPFGSNIASDSSEAQLIPNSQIYTATTLSGNVTVTANVSYKIILSSTITANIGDYITQFANTGNARVLQSVTNGNVIAVDFVTGVFQPAANIGTRVNLVSLTSGVSSLTANVISRNVLGSVFANGNVVLNSVSVLRSNIWEQFSTTLQNSTTTGAQFIKAEPSYIP